MWIIILKKRSQQQRKKWYDGLKLTSTDETGVAGRVLRACVFRYAENEDMRPEHVIAKLESR